METFAKEQVIVDVILPNCNKAEFLEEAINSVISQSYKNWKESFLQTVRNALTKGI